jgi:hypothetical protein
VARTNGEQPEVEPSARLGTPWEPIDRLREAARLLLEAVEIESGTHSELHRQCVEVWRRAEGEVKDSLLHADIANAFARLDRALDVLSRAPEIARRGELGLADLGALLEAM